VEQFCPRYSCRRILTVTQKSAETDDQPVPYQKLQAGMANVLTVSGDLLPGWQGLSPAPYRLCLGRVDPESQMISGLASIGMCRAGSSALVGSLDW